MDPTIEGTYSLSVLCTFNNLVPPTITKNLDFTLRLIYYSKIPTTLTVPSLTSSLN